MSQYIYITIHIHIQHVTVLSMKVDIVWMPGCCHMVYRPGFLCVGWLVCRGSGPIFGMGFQCSAGCEFVCVLGLYPTIFLIFSITQSVTISCQPLPYCV